MKKRYIIIIVILLILAVVAGIVGYQIIIENGKNYEITKVEQYNYFVLKQGDMYGVIDRNGNTVIAPQYSEIRIPNPEKSVFICYQENSVTTLNEKNEKILTEYNIEPIRLKNISSDLMYEKSVLKYEQDGKYGLISLDGKQITKPIYEDIDSLTYKEGALIVKKDGKYGVINIKGNKLVEIMYDNIQLDEYYDNDDQTKYAGYIVSVKTEDGYRYGYLNNKGKEILKTEYNEISRVTQIKDTENSYLICAKNGQYGIMKNEQELIANEYQSIEYDATNEVFIIEKSKKYGIANQEGTIIVPVQYNQIDITGIYFYAQNEQDTVVYNSNGTQVDVNPNIAIVNTNNEKYKIRINNEDGTKYGVINQNGQQLIEEKYNYIEYLHDNYFIVSNENSKQGIIDDKGNEKVEINKDSLQKLQGTDFIQTSIIDTKMTQIYNKNIEQICEMQNATVDVEENYIKVYNETETKYFSKEGKEIENTEVYPNNKLFVKVKDNKYGFVDSNGKLIVDYKYDKAYEFNEYGYATVKSDGKWGAINEQGEEVAPPTYEIKEQSMPSFIGKYYKVIYGFGEFYYTSEDLGTAP